MSTTLSSEIAGINLARSRSPSLSNSDYVRDGNSSNVSQKRSRGEAGVEVIANGLEQGQQNTEEIPDISEISNYLRGLEKSIRGTRIIHDVVPNIDERTNTYLYNRCISKKFLGGLFIWVFHTDHAHVIHDCMYSGNKCRCTRIQCLPIKIRTRKFHRFYSFCPRYLYNLTKYCCQPPRQFCHLEVGGRKWRIPSEIRNLSYERYCQFGQEPMVETRSDSDEFSDSQSSRSTSNINKQSSSISHETSYNPRKRQKGNKEEELLQWLHQFPTSPILGIIGSRVWMNSKYKFLLSGDNMVKSVFNVFNHYFVDKTFEEIYYYAVSVNPLYCSFKGNIFDYYYSVEESVNILNELLYFQFNNDEQAIVVFLTDLLNIIDKKIPKVNCLQIIAPASSGKNFFFDTVIHYFFNFGLIGNFNKYQQFPLMEAVNRRINLWNEPNAEPGAMDTLKMLFGGDNVNAKVKHMSDAVVSRTPIIVLTNKTWLSNDAAFQHRIITYNWKTAPFLKNYNKKPYPLSIYSLLQIHNII